MWLSETERATLADIERRLTADDPEMVRWFDAATSFMVDAPYGWGARGTLDDTGTALRRTRAAALHAGTMGGPPTFGAVGAGQAGQHGTRRGLVFVALLVAGLVAALSLVATTVARSSTYLPRGLSFTTPTMVTGTGGSGTTGPGSGSHSGTAVLGPH